MNAKIFINYRREDTAPIAGRLYDRLTAHFGEGQVLIDIDQIEHHVSLAGDAHALTQAKVAEVRIYGDYAGVLVPDTVVPKAGEDFVEAIKRKVGTCDIAIVTIGPNWLHLTDASGKRRLDDEGDFVRMEIVAALERKIPVIPVLVGGAHMPLERDFPEALAPLSRRNAIDLSETRFHADVNRLIEAIERCFAVVEKETEPAPTPAAPLEALGERVAAHPKARQAPPPELELAEAEPLDVFVSHSTSDRKWVEREIIALLKTRGLKPWYSKQSINTASQWEREILRGLESCQWFLIVVSPRAAESEWVKDELNWAVSNRPTRIVPVIMERCNLWKFHVRLPRIQHVDFTTDKRSARNQLVEAFTDVA